MITFKKYGFAICWNFLPKGYKYVFYNHDKYDGDFHCFGFWFFHIYYTNSPTVYLTTQELDVKYRARVEAFYVKNPNLRPKQ